MYRVNVRYTAPSANWKGPLHVIELAETSLFERGILKSRKRNLNIILSLYWSLIQQDKMTTHFDKSMKVWLCCDATPQNGIRNHDSSLSYLCHFIFSTGTKHVLYWTMTLNFHLIFCHVVLLNISSHLHYVFRHFGCIE